MGWHGDLAGLATVNLCDSLLSAKEGTLGRVDLHVGVLGLLDSRCLR